MASNRTTFFVDQPHAAPGWDESAVAISEHAARRYVIAMGLETELGNQAAEGAVAGGAIGAVFGAIAAAASAIAGTLVVPGLDVFVTSPLVAALLGGGAGLASGIALGALVGRGMLEERIKHREEPPGDGAIPMVG